MLNVSLRYDFFTKFVLSVLILLFPLGMGLVEHYSAGIFGITVILSFFILGRKWTFPEKSVRSIFFAFGILFFAALLSLLNVEDFNAAGRRLEKFLFLFYAIPLYLSIRKSKINLLKPLTIGLLLSGPIMFSVAIYSVHVMELPRAKGYYNPIVFGDMAILVALLLLTVLCSGYVSSWFKYLTLLSMSGALYASILSGSRGAWLAVPVVGLFLLIILRKQLSSNKKVIAIGILVISAVIIPNYERIESGMNRNELNMKSFLTGGSLIKGDSIRSMLWQQSIELWKEHPFIGVGVGDFRLQVKKNIANKHTKLQRSYGHAHNIFLDTLATTGMFGLLACVVGLFVLPARFFFSSIKRSSDNSVRTAALSGIVLIFCFAIFGLTEGWLARSTMLTTYLFLMIILLSAVSCEDDCGES